MYERIADMAKRMEEQLAATRRDFHRHPETAWLEMRTSSLIARRLDDLGYRVLVGEAVCLGQARMGLPEGEALRQGYERALEQGADPEYLEHTKGGFTGVIGVLDCGPGPVIALRFDIDALGVIEEEDQSHIPAREGFRSINHGAMHACGHDGHAAIGLGVAQALMEIRQELRGTVKLIFQPAEEGVCGARAIVEKGHLDDVDVTLACHITRRVPGDQDDARSDLNAGSGGSFATTKLDVHFRGRSAHAGGNPQEGSNALLAAATAALNLHAIPRHSKGDTRVNVGVLNAGTGRNVVADFALMKLEVRGRTQESNAYMEERARRIIKAAALMHDNSCEITVAGSAGVLNSTPALMERIRDVCQDLPGIRVHPVLCRQQGGSEDYAYMIGRVEERGGQGAMMRILTDVYGPAHSRTFDFDDHDALPKSVCIFASMVYSLLCGV